MIISYNKRVDGRVTHFGDNIYKDLEQDPYDLDEDPYDLEQDPYDLDEDPYDLDEDPYDLDEDDDDITLSSIQIDINNWLKGLLNKLNPNLAECGAKIITTPGIADRNSLDALLKSAGANPPPLFNADQTNILQWLKGLGTITPSETQRAAKFITNNFNSARLNVLITEVGATIPPKTFGVGEIHVMLWLNRLRGGTLTPTQADCGAKIITSATIADRGALDPLLQRVGATSPNPFDPDQTNVVEWLKRLRGGVLDPNKVDCVTKIIIEPSIRDLDHLNHLLASVGATRFIPAPPFGAQEKAAIAWLKTLPGTALSPRIRDCIPFIQPGGTGHIVGITDFAILDNILDNIGATQFTLAGDNLILANYYATNGIAGANIINRNLGAHNAIGVPPFTRQQKIDARNYIAGNPRFDGYFNKNLKNKSQKIMKRSKKRSIKRSIKKRRSIKRSIKNQKRC